MSTHVLGRAGRRSEARPVSARAHVEWLAAGLVLGFSVPFLLADTLGLGRDLYYGVYGAIAISFVFGWAQATGWPVAAAARRRLPLTLALAGIASALLIAIVFGTDDATARPGGIEFAAALAWRGLFYGAVDGLLLSAFPILVVFAAFAGSRLRRRRSGTIVVGAVALAASVLMTAVYHVGYSDFRGEKLRKPLVGDLIWSAPTLLTLNPIGAPIAHAALHSAAVVHSFETEVFLPPHAAAAPTIELAPCTIRGSLGECGSIQVAENPSDPGGRRIALSVAVIRATSPSPKPDPLFWFAGWGGAGVSDDLANVASAFVTVNIDRDLVFIDQRGTGSSKLVCDLPSYLELSDAAAVTAAARRCAQRSGPNLRYYTSAVAVDDVDQVRRALGYDAINLYGGSYGVTTGLIYLQRHGSHVRSAVFDSGSLLDVHIFERQLVNKQRALEQLFARCAADEACHSAYPDLRDEYDRLVARLARAPMQVPGTKVRLDPAVFASVLDDFIAYTPGKASVPRLIHLVATGRLARAAAELPATTSEPPGLAYQLLIQCNEPWASWRRGEIERLSRGSFLAPLFRNAATTMAAACAGFPKADVPAAVGQRVHSDVPILFLAGSEDGADPPANIANAQRELPNSRTVVFPGAGHGQLGLPCAQTLIDEFVARGTATGLDTSCARTAALQPFDTRE
jgi:pimeloyl-ACP methyl ester carboxylesterase